MRLGLDAAQIANLVARAGSPVSVRDYCHDLIRTRHAQFLEVLAGRLVSEINTNPKVEPTELLGWIESELVRMRSGSAESPIVGIGEVVEEVLAAHEREAETGQSVTIPTGIGCLDHHTGGMYPGHLWQIAARPFMGKTALALDVASKMSAWVNVLFVSLEMSRQELVDRLLARVTHIPIDRFAKGNLSPKELKAARQAEGQIKKMAIKFTTAYSETVQSIRAKVRLMQAQVGVGLVVVDNLQLIKPADPRAPRHERIKQCTIDLKTVARELGVPVLLLSQLNADAEGEEPTDKNYAGSKETIADLDVSLLMHRQSKDHPDVDLICTKNRRGGLPFRTKLIFDGSIQTFSEPKNEFEDWTG
jgi:replicative DNA helicase